MRAFKGGRQKGAASLEGIHVEGPFLYPKYLPGAMTGDGTHVQNAPPATLSRRILVDLLRERMGFEGVIITDAARKNGF